MPKTREHFVTHAGFVEDVRRMIVEYAYDLVDDVIKNAWIAASQSTTPV